MGNNVPKNKEENNFISIARLTYGIYGKNIRLFNIHFIERNKNKCKIIIGGIEREIADNISIKKLKKYGIKTTDKTFEVILKGETTDDMSYMFYYCNNLIKVDLSSFNTQNVTNISYMFSGCTNLVKVDLSSFNTQNVKDMSSIFSCCTNLSKVDLSSFNTQNVKNMSSMFYYCNNLSKIDLSLFNTQNVANMSYMFSGCINLSRVDLSLFNTQNTTEMFCMFSECKNLSLIKIQRKDFSKIKKKSRNAKLCIIEI